MTVILPAASGGNPPLTYRISPSLPAGLGFSAAARTITGTPTTEQSRREYAYSVTDSDGDSATINFGITVVAAPTSSGGACFVGQELRPGILAPSGQIVSRCCRTGGLATVAASRLEPA